MTDCEFLLDVLSDGEPHTLNEILNRSFRERGCGLTVHSRAADLRKRGHVVLNTHDRAAKRGQSSIYQLVLLRAARVPLQEPEGSLVARSGDGTTDNRADIRASVSGDAGGTHEPSLLGSFSSGEGVGDLPKRALPDTAVGTRREGEDVGHGVGVASRAPDSPVQLSLTEAA